MPQRPERYLKQSPEFMAWTRLVSLAAQEIERLVRLLRAGEDVWDQLFDARARLSVLIMDHPEQRTRR